MELLHFSKEGNMDQGIALMAGSLCSTLGYVEQIFHEHKKALKSIEFYINDFHENDNIDDMTDARWKKIIKCQKSKAKSKTDDAESILDHKELLNLAEQTANDIRYVTLTTDSCQYYKDRWVESGNIRKLKAVIDGYAKSWRRINDIYLNISKLIRQPAFLRYVRSSDLRRCSFWRLVDKLQCEANKIDHNLVAVYLKDLKNKQTLLTEQRYLEFIRYETGDSIAEDADEIAGAENLTQETLYKTDTNEEMFSDCKIKYIPLGHIAAAFKEISKLPDLTSASNLKVLTETLIAL